jgi:hypothetical protein
MDSTFFHLIHYFVLVYPSTLILFTFRGFFESLVALILGDRKPYEEGFLTLNPLVHVNIVGLTILLGILFALNALLGADGLGSSLFGWIAVLAIRYTYGIPLSSNFAFSSIRSGIIMLSGPMSYALLALMVKYGFAHLPFALFSLPVQRSLIQLLQMLGGISLTTTILQLFPIYPLDMGRALACFFPTTIGEFFHKYEEYSFFVIILFFTLLDVFVPGFFAWSATYLDNLLSYLVI